MRLTQLPILTSKEVPADAEIASHRLMLRAGLIRKLAAGLYTWLPLGLRVLRKVENIVREEMDASGALELLMPTVQPAELWQESERWDLMGAQLLRFKDRHERDFCYGPTHEEVITDIVRRELRSYRQLPVNFYQIQTKFRDEIRPRFGVMRAREFLMKDAYSFHENKTSLDETYQLMHDTYSRIFTRLGLRFRAVQADSGNIGGALSHEFHVLAESGEDAIAFSDTSDYAANVELAPAPAPDPRSEPAQECSRVETPKIRSMQALTEFLGVAATQCVKTLVVDGADGGLVALVLRGDHDLNPIKAAKLDLVASPLRMSSAERIRELLGTQPGFLGPVGSKCPVVADHTAGALADFICGANDADAHLRGVNWGRDLPEPTCADLRNVVAGEESPDGQGRLQIARGIEVGHIFQLGDKYATSMRAEVLDSDGRNVTLQMGCYGIGVSRVVAAAIEQNHDENGICWPGPIAPFEVALIPINMPKSYRVREAAEALYEQLRADGIEVLFDDRDARPGVKFADAELIGIPHRLVISERGLDAGNVEYKGRRDTESTLIPRADLQSQLATRIAEA